MKYYVVSAFRYEIQFQNENEARKHFDKIKNSFTYCELKEVNQDSMAYQSHSLEIFIKR